MTQKPDPNKAKRPAGPQSREDRLKAALKANLGRRKAQARARTSTETNNNITHEDAAPGQKRHGAGSEDD